MTLALLDKTPKFVPSSYQSAIADAVKRADRNILVMAGPGTGKTRTLAFVAGFIPDDQTVLAVAFNAHIQKAMAKALPTATTMTLNGLGHRAWTRFAESQGIEVQLEPHKLTKLCGTIFGPKDPLKYKVRDLVGKAKTHGLVPRSLPDLRGLMSDTDDNWLALAKLYNIEVPTLRFAATRMLDQCRDILTKSLQQKDKIDFDDQLAMTVAYAAPLPKYDWVFVDEAQDLSQIQLEMIAQCGTENTRYLFVGDKRQAIYQFRGADAHSMDNIRKRFDCLPLPLSITYRCPVDVVKLIQMYEPTILPAPGADKGVVTQKGDALAAEYQPGDLVVCRYNAPLLKVAYALIARRIPVVILGKDLSSNMTNLIKQIGGKTPKEVLANSHGYEARQLNAMRDDPETAAKKEGLIDRLGALRTILTSAHAGQTLSDLEEEIEDLFKAKKNAVTLSTVHGVKGSEADTVWIVDHDVVRQTYRTSEDYEAEMNIKFVGISRSKKNLYFVSYSELHSTQREIKARGIAFDKSHFGEHVLVGKGK